MVNPLDCLLHPYHLNRCMGRVVEVRRSGTVIVDRYDKPLDNPTAVCVERVRVRAPFTHGGWQWAKPGDLVAVWEYECKGRTYWWLMLEPEGILDKEEWM